MVILVKKAVRSIWRNKRTYLACILLIALGVATYVGFLGGHHSLNYALNQTYQTQRFGDVFATVTGVSETTVARLADVRGVAEVTARTTATVKIIDREAESTLSLQLISWDQEETDGLNQFQLQQGELPGRGEILLGEVFCQVQGYEIGDQLLLVSEKGQATVTISGTVSSPEFIARLEAEEALGGYGYLHQEELNAMKDNNGLYDDLVLRLSPGTAFQEIEAELEELLAPWGLAALYPRADHRDYQNASVSIDSLASSGTLIAYIFMFVAVLVLYILMRRIIEQERIQIGTLKAFGFSELAILSLYTGYGAVVGLLGGAVGCLLGLCIANWAANLFYELFQMEAAVAPLPYGLFAQGLLLSLVTGIAAAFLAAKALLALGPAEAMRPPAPPAPKSRRAKRANRGGLTLPSWVALVWRSIIRGRGRSVFVIVGLAGSFTILVFMSAYSTLMEELSLTQYEQIERYDVSATLQEPMLYREARQAALAVDGVEIGEAVLALNITIQHQNQSLDTVYLTGVAEGSELYQLYDSRHNVPRPLPRSGLAVNAALAEKLGVSEGDLVYLTTPYSGNRKLPVTIQAVEAINFGYQAFMEITELCALLDTGVIANQILLQTDHPETVVTYLEGADNVATVSNQQDLRHIQQSTLAQTNGANVLIFAVVGLGIALAIIISTASISLSERAREYATLLVLGMGTAEVARIMTVEYVALTLISFLPGVPLAVGLKMLLLGSLSGEAVIASPFIAPPHYFVGGTICLAAALLANLQSWRQIGRLELTEVLKERE